MKEIPLTKGYTALVDDEDFELLSKLRWCVRLTHGKPYARRRESGPTKPYKTQQMHRVIMGVTDPKIGVDHRDGNPLNNQRHNLRICTQSQNLSNRSADKRSKTGFKGVSKFGDKWRAYIVVNYKQISLKLHNTPEQAARAYDAAAIIHHGEFARLNFPQ